MIIVVPIPDGDSLLLDSQAELFNLIFVVAQLGG